MPMCRATTMEYVIRITLTPGGPVDLPTIRVRRGRDLGYDGIAGEMHDIIGFCQQLWPHAADTDETTQEDQG